MWVGASTPTSQLGVNQLNSNTIGRSEDDRGRSEACMTFVSPGARHELTIDQERSAVAENLRRAPYRKRHRIHVTCGFGLSCQLHRFQTDV
jgi:hypothetical protein